MNDLIPVIREYQDNIKQGVLIMQKEFGTNALLTAWRTGHIARCGEITNKLSYEFHGVGCLITINNLDVDFDFGNNNTFGGFEPWRLYSFVSQMIHKYPRYVNKSILDKDFKELIEKGIIFCPKDEHGLYYLVETTVCDSQTFL